MGFVPEDRLGMGLASGLSLEDNLVLKSYRWPPHSRGPLLSYRAIHHRARELIERFDIRGVRPGLPVRLLSGGNLQRAILAREISQRPRVLVAASPTRGLDVGAIEFVWDRLREQRDRGVAIVLISTDLDEVLALADRCHVLYRGRLVGAWSRAELDREAIGLAMGGARDGVGAAGGSPLPDGSSASPTAAVTPWP
jgi:simple sugar transport system ATP-binding protein